MSITPEELKRFLNLAPACPARAARAGGHPVHCAPRSAPATAGSKDALDKAVFELLSANLKLAEFQP